MLSRSIASAAFTFLAAFAAAESFGAIQTREINVRESAGFVFPDAATGRMFLVNPGHARFQSTASYSVVEPDGSLAITYVPGATNATFSEKWRTLAIAITSGADAGQVVLVDADTLAQSAVATGSAPYPVAISEATGKLYVAGSNALAAAPWLVPGTGSGTLTEVDLRTRTARTVPVEGFQPRHLAVDPAGSRIYAVGTNYMRTGEEVPGFMRAFDASTLAAGALTPLGRRPEAVMMSSDGKSLLAVSHVDWTYPPMYAEIGRAIRAALHVVDTRTMATRTIVLPAYDDLFLNNGVMLASMAEGARPETVYVLDWHQSRLIVVDVPSGTTQVSALESFGRAVGYNAVTGKVMVMLPRLGHVAVFSAGGDRLDTVSVGPGLEIGAGPTYSIATDKAGNSYATNGPAGVVSVLRADVAAMPSAPVNMTDLWWNPAQSGWGLFVDQQATTAFATLFIKDAAGQPRWYVMSAGKRQNDGAFAGTLYRTTGPASTALASARPVGSMRIAPEVDGGSTLSYTIDGTSVSTPIQRQVFAAARSCGWAVGAAKSAGSTANFTSLWFDAAEPGWGVAVSHQGDTVFGVLFTYAPDGQPTWAAMSNGSARGDGAFGGTLYRVGPGASVESVGSMSLAFGDATRLAYSLDGFQVSRGIQRQTFAPLVSDCGSQ